MAQLDLFGSLFDAQPPAKKQEDKSIVLKKEKKEGDVLGADDKIATSPQAAQQEAAKDDVPDLAGTIDFMVEDEILPGSSSYPSLLNEQAELAGGEQKPTRSPEYNSPVTATNSVADVVFATEVPAEVIVETSFVTAIDEVQQTVLPSSAESEMVLEEPEPVLKQKPEQKAVNPRVDSVVFDEAETPERAKKSLSNTAYSAKTNQEKLKKLPQKRGRKSIKEIDAEVDLIEIPEDEVLFQKQYYPISEVAKWFRVNTSLIRFWENEFDVLKPRKNRKGDRMFRPEDVKNLQLIHHLLRQKKYTVEGAKEYLKTNKKKADLQNQLTSTLQKFRSFLLDLKANLE
jgi:DNA-binding transcriptional MerR regulator